MFLGFKAKPFLFLALLLHRVCTSPGLGLEDSTMGNCLNSSCSSLSISEKNSEPLPIETIFNLPSAIPAWPPGKGFANGSIDLGGILVYQVSSFNKTWATHEGGPDNLGATFYEPSSIPKGYFMLGSYSQPNNKLLFGWVLTAKDVTNNHSRPALKMPVDYTLVWSSESLNINQDGHGYIWLPIPPAGYNPVGHIVTSSPEKPPLDKIRCVRSDFTDSVEVDSWIWGQGDVVNYNGLNVYGSRPSQRGIQSLGVPTGTFIAQAQNNGTSMISACLKNVKASLSAMPTFSQIRALVQAYSPWVYFHPDEQYLPSSVGWFFQNGALLYTKGNESNPSPIELKGSNLPQSGSNDGAYWLDLPRDQHEKERVQKGDLQDAEAYLHIKPVLGGTFTDIVVWLFYPFNGAARAKIKFLTVSLGKIGEHVGDWEHVTLRVSNFDGALRSVYFSQHNGGVWVDAPGLEFQNGSKPVAYASLHGHAMYSSAGLVLQGNDGVGLRNDCKKSNMVMDTGTRSIVFAAEFLPLSMVVEPPWLNYARKWGPNISYNTDDELKKVEKFLLGKLKSAFKKFVDGLPKEVFGEEGPIGPKMKDSWNGEENS
ncbi:hypothetical protein RJ640_029689 [Escallonia rubra]|uniref:Vacuolar protein sorting-associated protein 62 n=1 Tax=Escallonia rubra TaxID=112253 RepID=A0AA88QLY1_9ASTE|nr:hypothetical protein RJ640_029689 [Escallonia rubra]